MQFEKIAHIKTDFPEKFGIPRQSGIVKELRGEIVFEPKYRDINYIRGIEEFSHLWLIWEFSDNEGKEVSPTVRPPRLGGNVRKGVFATRSPFRPNPIGLSSVKIEEIREDKTFGTVIVVSGADMKDGTPIFDIKPYIPHSDIHPDAKGGFSDEVNGTLLDVFIPEEIEKTFDERTLKALYGILSDDPRPAYHNDPKRIYGFLFAKREIKFSVQGQKLTVLSAERIDND